MEHRPGRDLLPEPDRHDDSRGLAFFIRRDSARTHLQFSAPNDSLAWVNMLSGTVTGSNLPRRNQAAEFILFSGKRTGKPDCVGVEILQAGAGVIDDDFVVRFEQT